MSTCTEWGDQLVSKCQEWSSQHEKECLNWSKSIAKDCREQKNNASQKCLEWKDEGSDQCAEREDQGSRQCSDRYLQECHWYSPWNCIAGWVCTGWHWVSKWVCVAWHWVSNWVCQTWYWITDMICQTVYTIIVPSTCMFSFAVLGLFCRATGGSLKLGCGLGELLAGILTVRIVISDDDEPHANSIPRLTADAMSVAHVNAANEFKDSGQRYFFKIIDKVVWYRTLSTDWVRLAPNDEYPLAINYKRKRKGELTIAPEFDMVAANSGRVIAKEIGYARFYVAMIEPMFRRYPNIAVPSMYFKLDPEQGQRSANNKDRLQHLAVDDNTHPAAVRFPLFRYAMQLDLNDSMVVNMDANLKVWHRIDGRPPKDGGEPPIVDGFPPTGVVVEYQPNITLLPRIKKKGYRVCKVLDIGVGHEHWHEQRSSVYGGDMDSLDGPGLRPCIVGRDAYRLFNGPVEDQGGFIDGTVNYYVLAQFVEDDWVNQKIIPGNAFGILWLDEQAVLSERWRLLDPDDSSFGSFKDVIPSAAVQYLEKDFADSGFKFDRSKYWCPMRAGHVTSESRMAVSRAVIILSGRDPSSDEWELYSINFSFGTADRTWRWRKLPIHLVKGSTMSPEAFGLREDMILYVKDSRSEDVRYWYQHYLPASTEPMPKNNLELVDGMVERPNRQLLGSKPNIGFSHDWQWLPQDVFEFIHAHNTHFGCYEDIVNWRWQYYRVTVLDGESALTDGGEGACWSETVSQLFILKDSINWTRLNKILNGETDDEVSADLVVRLITLASAIPGGVAGAFSNSVSEWLFGAISSARQVGPIRTVLCQIYNELRNSPLVTKKHHHGLFYPKFLLKLIYREPFGWIMMHWDKRDDDLLPFSNIMSNKDGTPLDISLTRNAPSGEQVGVVRVRLDSYHQVPDMPQVKKAKVIIKRYSLVSARLRIELLPCKHGEALDKNIWRIKLGYVARDEAGILTGFVQIFNEIRLHANRQSDELGGIKRYEWDIIKGDVSQLDRLAECCSELGRQTHGTSLWIEDIVGHVAIPDSVEYYSEYI